MTQHYSINNVTNDDYAVYEHATSRIVHRARTREACRDWLDTWVLYLRKEAFTSGAGNFTFTGRCVRYYRDPGAAQLLCVDPWPSRPTRRNKWVMYNCARYRACWLPDLEKGKDR